MTSSHNKYFSLFFVALLTGSSLRALIFKPLPEAGGLNARARGTFGGFSPHEKVLAFGVGMSDYVGASLPRRRGDTMHDADEILADVATAYLSMIRTLDELADASEGTFSVNHHIACAADTLAASDFLASITSARVALIGRA